jgi:micrococcal nuclease
MQVVPFPRKARKRAPLLYWRERRLFAFVFVIVLLVGLVATYRPALAARTSVAEIMEAALFGLLGAALLSFFFDHTARRLWHALANAFPERHAIAVLAPCVIDGDTLVDGASGVRYRFANIDAPETGDGARCANEAQRGELARLAVVAITNRAKTVTVRRTWRLDQYGRRIAFVYADGVDIGEALVAKGFARPWRGKREKWCGPRGGLAKIAESRAMPISCKACGAWSKL